MRPETLTEATVSLSPDTIAVRDTSDEKCVHLFDASTGKPLNDGKPFVNRNQEIAEIALDQTGLPNQRKMAFVDKNRDLFLTNIRFNRGTAAGAGASPGKLGSMVQSIKWNSSSNMLATIQVSNHQEIWHNISQNVDASSF